MNKYKLIWASSTVYRCANCKAWIIRQPDFMGEPFDKGWQCEKCGCTSVSMSKGRPFGKKSKEISWLEKRLNEDMNLSGSHLPFIVMFELVDTVKTIPALVVPSI